MLKIAVILLSIYHVINQSLTSYSDTNFKNHWSCESGRRQSPVPLEIKESKYSNDFTIVYERYKVFDDMFLTFQGNLLEVRDLESELTKINKKGHLIFAYEKYHFKFDLEQIVIKVPSEHLIDGIRSDLEVQFIHRKDLTYFSEVDQFKSKPDISQFLIISVLYSKDGTFSDSGFLENLSFSYLPSGISNTNAALKFKFKFDLIESGLIRDKKAFVYSGSETVFPCSETHLHFVVADKYKISQNLLDFYKNEYMNRYTGNIFAKEVNKLNGRQVLRNFFNTTQESDFHAFSKYINLKIAILLILGLLF